MNCRKAYLWMLSADAAEGPLPSPLRRHLRLCRKCSRRRKRLLRLSWEVRRKAPLVDEPAARARILAALPQPIAVPIPLARRRRRVYRLPWAVAAAAVLLFAILTTALVFLKRGSPGPIGPIASAPPPDAGDLLNRVVGRDLSLAQADGPADQLQAMAALASDLWSEAARQARQTERLDLPLLTHLYERVVIQGVVGRALALDDGKRGKALPPVVDQLRQTADAADRLATEAPDAASDLDRLSLASRGAVRAIQGEGPVPVVAPPEALPADAPPKQQLLQNLVAQSLRLAEADDPVRRADCGAAIVDSLTQTIVVSSGQADGQMMVQLGGFMAQIQSQAIDENLDRVTENNLDRPGREEIDRVRQRTADAMGLLEQTVQQAPPAARAALNLALEAARGDAPPADPDGKHKVPPGLAKHGKHEPPGQNKKHGPND